MDGSSYKGLWEKGKQHGKGTLTFSDGTKYVGEFKKGDPLNIKVIDKYGKITDRFLNGVKQ